jgi:hypothetical protein
LRKKKKKTKKRKRANLDEILTFLATVGPGEAVSSKLRNQGKVEAKLLHKPLDGGPRVVGQHLDELRAEEITSRAGSVPVQLFFILEKKRKFNRQKTLQTTLWTNSKHKRKIEKKGKTHS